MRTRIFLVALAAGGLWIGSVFSQGPTPGPVPQPPASNPATTPDNTPKNAKPGTGPATQPDNTPSPAPRNTGPATQPDNGGNGPTPPTPRPPAVGVPGVRTGGTAVGGSTGTASTGAAGATTTAGRLFKVSTLTGTSVALGTEALGKVTEVVINDSGFVQYLVVQTGPDRFIAVPWGVATADFERRTVTLRGRDVTAEKLRTMAFPSDTWPNFADPAWAERTGAMWGVSSPRVAPRNGDIGGSDAGGSAPRTGTAPGGAVGTAVGGTAVGRRSGKVGVAGTTPETKVVAIPPELAKLEAKAAVEIPVPVPPAGRAPEAVRVAEAAVKVQRATWVVEKLLPAAPDGIVAFNFAAIKVGSRGWINTTAEVMRTAEGVAIVRPAANVPESVIIGMPATESVTAGKVVDLRGEFAVDRAATVDGREVFVLKQVTPAEVLTPEVAALVTAARKRLEDAKAEYANAAAVLAAARKKAMDAALEQASVEAAKQIPIPDSATGEERIKAKRDQDDLAQKIARPELEKIAAHYGDVPGGGR